MQSALMAWCRLSNECHESEESDNSTKGIMPDVLFLLLCFYSFMCDNEKKWKSKEIERKKATENANKMKMEDAFYGRSFLKNGKGILRAMLRKAMTTQFDKLLYLDVVGRKVKDALIIFPRSIYQDLFWSMTINFEELCDPLYAKSLRLVMSQYIKRELFRKQRIIDEIKTPRKTIKDYEKKNYSLADELYWTLQYQQMEDLVCGLDECLNSDKFSVLKYDMLAMLDYIYLEYGFPTAFDLGSAEEVNKTGKSEDSVAQKAAIWFIISNFDGYTEDTLARSFRRHKTNIDKLYQFYEQGVKCFRDESYYLDDFQQAAFFEPMLDRCSFLESQIRCTYIKGIMSVILTLYGWEKIFPAELETVGTEKNISLNQILKKYKSKQNGDMNNKSEQEDDMEYAKNGTYYLLWNFLNEILEWGFEGAKEINAFRKYVFLPYCKNAEVGLKNDSDSIESITLDTIRSAAFVNYDEWIYDTGSCLKSLLIKRLMSDAPISRDVIDDLVRTNNEEGLNELSTMSFTEILRDLSLHPDRLPRI